MTELICIVCPKGCHLKVDEENDYKVTGNTCAKGEDYGKIELKNPTRVITSTVRCEGGMYPRCSVKTDAAIPKGMINDAMKTLDSITLKAPVELGQIVVKDVCGTGANFVATRAM